MDELEKFLGLMTALLGVIGAIASLRASNPKYREEIVRRSMAVNTLLTMPQTYAKLVHQGKTIYIHQGINRLGSLPDNHIVLNEPSVSRSHATLEYRNTGDVILSDSGSLNGSCVNGQRITQPTRLRDGDVIGFGTWQGTFYQTSSHAMPQVAAYTPINFVPAGFWLRLGAFAIDNFLLSIPYYILLGIVMAIGGGEVLPVLIWFPIRWLYSVLMESSEAGATIGKQMVRIRVVDTNGQRISFGRANGRFFAKILSDLILLIGYLMVGFTQKKQGLHDILAGTLVIQRP